MITQVTSAAEVKELYPVIEEGCREISLRSDTPEQYFAPDVYRNIISGQFILFVLHDDDGVWGWGTGYFDLDMSGAKVGICQDLYIQKGSPKHLVGEFIDFFEKFSASDGAASTAFITSRMEWERVVGPKGYKLIGYIFKKGL